MSRLAFVLAVIVVACGSGVDTSRPTTTLGTPEPTATEADSTTLTTAAADQLRGVTPNRGDLRVMSSVDTGGTLPGDTLITCRAGPSFPASALDEFPFVADLELPGVEEAMGSFLETEEGVFWPQSDWRILHQTETRMMLVHYSEGEGLSFMDLERADGEWEWKGASSGGRCALRLALPEQVGAVEWRLDPSAESLSPESTMIHLLATERTCASGQAMGDRLLGPEVVVTDAEIRIAFAAEPLLGGQTCPSNPEQAVVIEMSGPIGSRVVVDGLALGVSLVDYLRD